MDKNLKLLVIASIILMMLEFCLGIWLGRNVFKNKKFDYQIDLYQDSINITTSQNKDTTIHFDDLEKYIIKDNL